MANPWRGEGQRAETGTEAEPRRWWERMLASHVVRSLLAMLLVIAGIGVFAALVR